jgi:hypothetical protein
MTERLLILACSQRKTSGKGQLPAINRYDGPAFRVLRKFLRENPDPALTVLILSAKYGLIESERKIPFYDCRLFRTTTARLQRQVLGTARNILRSQPWQAVGICAGKNYRSALVGFAEEIPEGIRLDVLEGGLGRRLTALRDWLHRSAAEIKSVSRERFSDHAPK